MPRVNFIPKEGLILNGAGNFEPDPNVPNSGLSYSWFGSGAATELSFTVYRGVMTGRFSQGNVVWAIATVDGVLVFRKLDISAFPSDADDEFENPQALNFLTPPVRTRSIMRPDLVDEVTILPIYTPLARTRAGGQAALDSLIEASMADMNQALENSGITSLRVTNVQPLGNPALQVNYSEVSAPPPDCQSPVCNFLYHRKWARDNTASLRNQYAADLVVLFVGDTTACGVAYTQRPNCGELTFEPSCDVGADYDPFAYSVVSSSCAVADRTFAHEVGHQFGMEHDRFNGASNPSFLWSHGHIVNMPPIRARTIMSYQICGGGMNACPIYLHYSNPDIDFLPFPGTPSGTRNVDGFGRWTYNARTASFFAEEMSHFRGAAVTERIFRNSFELLPIP